MDNSAAWTLALVPLLFVGFDLGLYVGGFSLASSSLIALASTLLANTGLSLLDLALLRRRASARNIGAAWGLIPGYLFRRQLRLRQSLAIPIVWCASFVLSLTFGLLIQPILGYAIDENHVAELLHDEILDRSKVDLDVQCPHRLVKVGQTFVCFGTGAAGKSVEIDVTLRSSRGDIEWKAAGL